MKQTNLMHRTKRDAFNNVDTDCERGACLQEAREEKREKTMLCILLLKKRVHYLPVLTAVFIIGSFFIS